MTDLVGPTLVAVVAGAVASVAGFGIGSLLTPVLAPLVGVPLAVAAVGLPHAVGTALRLWRLRAAVDRAALRRFGVPSAAGGLAGALAHGSLGSPALGAVFGGLLVLAGLAGWTRWPERLRLDGAAATAAGALSGVFGGLVGNQGSIRSAALLAVPLERDAFVATATATALVVDAARLPVYAVTSGAALVPHAALLGALCAGVAVGTVLGGRVLARLPERAFRRSVATLLLALGAWMIGTAV